MTTLTAILGAALATILTAVAAYFRGIKAGRNSEIVKKANADADRQAEFDEIDSRAPDLDDAIDQLRKRSSGDGRPASK